MDSKSNLIASAKKYLSLTQVKTYAEQGPNRLRWPNTVPRRDPPGFSFANPLPKTPQASFVRCFAKAY